VAGGKIMPDQSVEDKKLELQRKILGVKIRHARTRAGLNLKEAGQLLNMSDSTLADIEYGRREVTLPQLEVLALRCNVPVIYFWSEEIISEPDLDFPAQEAMVLRHRIIGVLLRQARKKAGYTQEELARLLDVPDSRIANYEFGKTPIPMTQLEMLAKALNVSLMYFLDQGMQVGNGHGPITSLDDVVGYANLTPEVKEFLSNPGNVLYINIAMKLSELSADTLRALAEGLLEVTY
jgi:transcriptional regulator with XRE-family HTH domain